MSKSEYLHKMAGLSGAPDSPVMRAARAGSQVWQPALQDAPWQAASPLEKVRSPDLKNRMA
jgi:hypothetical protein